MFTTRSTSAAAGLLFAALTVLLLLPVGALRAQDSLRVTSVRPDVHPTTGGTRILVVGTGFDATSRALVGGRALGDQRIVDSHRIVGEMPSLPAGEYDVRVTKSGDDDVELLLAVFVCDKLLPPVDSLRNIRGPSAVTLSWANLLAYDRIEIKRGTSEVIASLPGDADRYVDELESVDDPSPLYLVTGFIGSLPSYAAFSVALPMECPPQLVALASTNVGNRLLTLEGEGDEELLIPFEVPAEGAPLGLSIEVLSRRLDFARSLALKARIRMRNAPGEIVEDDIVLKVPASPSRIPEPVAEPSWREGLSTTPLDPGEYLLGFYVEGGSEIVNAFRLPLQDLPVSLAGLSEASRFTTILAEFAGPSFEPSPILARAYPRTPAAITDIRRIRKLPVHPATYDHLLEPARSSDPNEDGPETTVVLFAEFRLEPGTPVIATGARFEWNFGDGESAISSAPIATHTYREYGVYDVRLRVLDFRCHELETIAAIRVQQTLAPEPASGEPPRLSHFRPNPEVYTVVPESSGIDVRNVFDAPFSFLVTPAPDAWVRSVRVAIVDPVGDDVRVIAAARTSSDPSDPEVFWNVRIPPDAWPDEPFVDLEVRAEDSQGNEAVERFRMELCPVPIFLRLDDIGTTVSYSAMRQEYDVTARFPPEPLWEETWGFGSPLDFTIENKIDARIEAKMRLKDHQWIPESLEGGVEVKLLDVELFEASFPPIRNSDPEALTLLCPDLSLKFQQDDIEILPRQDWEWDLFDGTVYSGWLGPVHLQVKASISVGLYTEMLADITVILHQTEGQLEVEVFLKPTFGAWAEGQLKADVFFGLVSGRLKLRAALELLLPTVLRMVNDQFEAQADVCFRIDLDGEGELCLLWGLGCWSGETDLFEASFPSGCDVDFVVHGGGGDEDEPELLEIRSPTLATSFDGRTSLLVFSDDKTAAEDAYEPNLVFDLYDHDRNSVATGPDTIELGRFVKRDPDATFLPDGRAIAVWTQNRLSIEKLAERREEEDLLDPEVANRGFGDNELAFAFFDRESGWSPTSLLTDDSVSDGMAKIASSPGADGAWVAWVRSETKEFLRPDGTPDLSRLAIYSAFIRGDGAVSEVTKLSSSAGDGLWANVEPTIAVSEDGSFVYVVWVQDRDADFNTSDDRVLRYSFFSSRGWSRVRTIAEEVPGPLMPSIALAAGDNGLLTFTARDIDETGTPLGEGNHDIVHTMVLRDGVLSPPEPLENRPALRPASTRAVFGRWPQAVHLGDGEFALAYRKFDGFGRTGGYGDMAVSRVDIFAENPRCAYPRLLTNDGERDWEIVAARGPDGLFTVRNCSAAGAAVTRGLVPDSAVFAPDIVVDALTASDPHAAPGSKILVTAVLRNAGLRPFRPVVGPLPTPNLHVELVNLIGGDGVDRLDVLDLVWAGEPDEVLKLTFPLHVPAAGLKLAVVVTADGDSNEANNTLDGEDALLVGVRPPSDVACSTAHLPERTRVMLSWTNGEAYDEIQIYRNGVLRARLRGGAILHIDDSVAPGAHSYSVRGRVRDTLSEAASGACAIEVDEPPPVGARFVRGDSNADAQVNISDPIAILGFLFAGGDEPRCLNAADANDDGAVNIADPVHELNFLFGGGDSVPPPSPECGLDPTPSGVTCESFPPCE